MNNKWIKFGVVGVLMVTLVIGLAAFAPFEKAGAQDASLLNDELPPGPMFGNADEALAEELGITLEELEAAHEAAFRAAVEQAVEDGRLSQERADDMLSGDFDGGRPGRGVGFMAIGIDEYLADELGIPLEDLQAARGRVREAALALAVEEGELTQEELDLFEGRQALAPYLREAMQEAYQNAIDQALEDGAITQAQAEQLLEQQGDGFAGRGSGMRGGPFRMR